MPELEFISVRKVYASPSGENLVALADFSLKVDGGRFVSVVGPSGCGNTTLLRMAAGLIPAIRGMSTSNPVNQQMLNFVSQDHLTAYPMLDNVVQPEVVTTGSKVLPSVLNGTMTPSAALQNMQTTFGQLPSTARGTSYP